MSFLTSCPPDGCYINPECDIEKKGRVIAAALVKKSAANLVDKSSGDAFLVSLWLLALQGNATLILNTSGEKPRPETAELPGRGMRINKPGAKTHTINLIDMQILGNIDFYNKILRNSQNFDFYYFTPDLYWDVSGEQVTIIGDPVIQNDLTQYIGGEVTIKWVSNGNPLTYEFDTDAFLVGLYYEISGPSTATTGLGSGDNLSYTATLNQTITSGSLPDVVWSLDSSAAIIESLGAVIDQVSGDLEINAIDEGVFVLTVKATSETGCVFGTLDVTVTVTA
jgi:hypothetical protein